MRLGQNRNPEREREWRERVDAQQAAIDAVVPRWNGGYKDWVDVTNDSRPYATCETAATRLGHGEHPTITVRNAREIRSELKRFGYRYDGDGGWVRRIADDLADTIEELINCGVVRERIFNALGCK